MTPKRVSIDRKEALDEIQVARQKNNDFGDGGSLFLGINNNGLLSDGTRVDKTPLLRVFNNTEWQRELAVYAAADLNVKVVEQFKGELTQCVNIPELGDKPLEVRYYGLEPRQDGMWGSGQSVLDPRAHCLPMLLTDMDIVWPFIYIYAEVKTMNTSVTMIGEPASANAGGLSDEASKVLAEGLRRDWKTIKCVDTPLSPMEMRSPSPEPRRSKTCAFGIKSEHWDAGLSDGHVSDKRSSARLQAEAKQAAAEGDHKEAFKLMQMAMALACAPPVQVAHESEYAPAREEASLVPPSGADTNTTKKGFKPAVTYKLSNDRVHVIPAGLYTEDEFFQKTLEAQDLVAASKAAALTKFDAPLTRSMSTAESMEGAEALKDQIAASATRARSALSKDASPVLSAAPAPDLSDAADAADAADAVGMLGKSIAETSIAEKDGDAQQAKWAATSAALEKQAASIWGPG